MIKKKYKFYRQLNAMDCGPTCLRIVAHYYGRYYSTDTLKSKVSIGKTGVSMLSLSEAAESIGLRTRGVKVTYEQLRLANFPCIAHWGKSHYIVVISVSKTKVKVIDPALGNVDYSKNEFLAGWTDKVAQDFDNSGILLLLEPTNDFYKNESDIKSNFGWSTILRYLSFSNQQIYYVAFLLLLSSVLELIFPFLTESIVDFGINSQNLDFVTIILVAQLILTFSSTVVELVRNRIIIRLSNILNLNLLSDFWVKISRLPLSYFQTYHKGDIIQRITDHKQIQSFISGTVLSTLVSVFNFLVYALVLIIFKFQLFLFFCIGSILYFGWIQLFLKFRRKYNYESFRLSTKENILTYQLIEGVQDIRLNNAEKSKRWAWENMQALIFKLNFKILNYNQIQQTGATLINYSLGFVISYYVATLVINGEMTFGEMLAIQYVVGRLILPVQQFVGFIQNYQDARISLERIGDIHELNEEEELPANYITTLPDSTDITVSNLFFKYSGLENGFVLNDINLTIQSKKVLAIVGDSGSGKSTLLKLLLKIHDDYQGNIKIGNPESDTGAINLKSIKPSFWRKMCGAVLQDGYIFNDTISNNIIMNEEDFDYLKLIRSCKIAQINDFIESLPEGYNTKIGVEGIGMSQGQKQRILIARAIYNDPEYLFFDEATSALDANNEKAIIQNLDVIFEGKTVVIVAHRLSTIINADKIIVMEKGRIVEVGTHTELKAAEGKYYQLVKNQLDSLK